MSEVRYVPPTYKCRDHGHDLTSAVLEAVEDDAIPVGSGFGFGRRRRVEGHLELSFQVHVQCPGPEAHECFPRIRRT